MALNTSKKMEMWLSQLGEELRDIEMELEAAKYAVEEAREKRSVILRKMNFVHIRSHVSPKETDSEFTVEFDAYSYLPKGKTASDTLSKNYG